MKARTFWSSAAMLVMCLTARRFDVAAQATVMRSSGVMTIAGTPHPYLIEGQGLPCIVVGPAPGYSSLFSSGLKQELRLILVDFKNTWGAEASRGVDGVTLDVLVQEIDAVRQNLGLDRICVLGHSAAGLLVLEYAAQYPEHMSHGILISAPPSYNRGVPAVQERFWQSDASPDRKAVKARLDQRLSNATLQALSPNDAFAMRYVRNGPKYFYDAAYDFSWAWIGRNVSAAMFARYFDVIMTDYDPLPRLLHNPVPFFLVLGRYDYAVPFSMWTERKTQIPHVSSVLLEHSGHFAMLEEPALFDARLIAWLKSVERR